jgi:hypothetical protein
MVTFLSELNGMELWATDIGNAYLEAYTAEKLFIHLGARNSGNSLGKILVFSAIFDKICMMTTRLACN